MQTPDIGFYHYFTLIIKSPVTFGNWYDYLEVAGRDGSTYAFVVGEDGLARPATSKELEEYLEGGEYDARLLQIDSD